MSEDVVAWAWNIWIYETWWSLVENIAVWSVWISWDTVTINPSSDLSNSTEYYVLIAATALDDSSWNSYAGIPSDTEALSFTTVAWGWWCGVVDFTVTDNEIYPEFASYWWDYCDSWELQFWFKIRTNTNGRAIVFDWMSGIYESVASAQAVGSYYYFESYTLQGNGFPDVNPLTLINASNPAIIYGTLTVH